MKSVVLQTRILNESHTGINTSEVLKAAAEEWGLSNKVFALTTDNASNMKIAAIKAEMQQVGCLAHTLNLAAHKATDLATVSNLLAKVKTLVSYFHRSTVANAVLREKQELLKIPAHKLMNDVRTRWNSSYLMLERYIEQQTAVHAALLDEKIRKQRDAPTDSNITSNDLTHAEQFLRLMEPLYQATLVISDEGKPTGIFLFLFKLDLNVMKNRYHEQ